MGFRIEPWQRDPFGSTADRRLKSKTTTHKQGRGGGALATDQDRSREKTRSADAGIGTRVVRREEKKGNEDRSRRKRYEEGQEGWMTTLSWAGRCPPKTRESPLPGSKGGGKGLIGTLETCRTRTLERGRWGWGMQSRGLRGCKTSVGKPLGPPWEHARASKQC